MSSCVKAESPVGLPYEDGRLPALKFQKALHRVRFKVPFEPVFFVHILQWFAERGQLESQSAGAGIKHLPREVFARLEIPFVPLEVQKEIVAEIEGYQKVINGARAVLDHYRPHIPIHPDWPMVELSEVCDNFQYGSSLKSSDNGEVVCLRMGNIQNGEIDWSDLNPSSAVRSPREKTFL